MINRLYDMTNRPETGRTRRPGWHGVATQHGQAIVTQSKPRAT